jgi:radical SAM superfamily enzyme YgiQ (UPF0313 family)
MQYEGMVIRPPSEANSIILQVTVGCTHNHCTFCGAYRDKQFRIKDDEIIHQDIEFAKTYCRRQKTVFLADGNALVIQKDKLAILLKTIRKQLSWVRRISLYANSRDILRYSVQELQTLKSLGLGRIYMGLESGHNPTLKAICKGTDAENMIAAGQQVREAGIFLSVTCLLGIAGRQASLDHARATAEVLNAMKPAQTAVLTLMVLDGTPLADMIRKGTFEMIGKEELFLELRTLIENLDLQKGQFQANHASNYFSLSGRLPKDKQIFLDTIDQAISGTFSLKPESMRSL